MLHMMVPDIMEQKVTSMKPAVHTLVMVTTVYLNMMAANQLVVHHHPAGMMATIITLRHHLLRTQAHMRMLL